MTDSTEPLVDISALDPLITLEEINPDINVPVSTLRTWAKEGDIPARKIGQRWFIRRSEWEAFLDSPAVDR
jgi:excisionase family DNA binding protein